MDNQLAVQNQISMSVMEQVITAGDLSKLTAEQRVNYYNAVCESVGLNPLTRPFEYIRLNNKLTLYARKDATEQLRRLNGVSITNVDTEFVDDLIIVTVTVQDGNGRSDTDIGAVSIGTLRGEAKANAIMKAITKAKRRVTLSISGLGWLDESEIPSIRNASQVTVTDDGEIIEGTLIEDSPQYTEAQQTICDAPAADFFNVATALIERYDNVHATKNAAKKLGYGKVPGNCAERVAMFDAIAEYANSRDAEEAQE